MARNTKLLSVQRPSNIPCTVDIFCEKSVESMSATKKIEENGELRFIIGPTYFRSPIVKRKLTFSYEKTPSLGYKHLSAGQIEPGDLSYENKRIYLFLENS